MLDPAQPEVALTFDDGPDARFTSQVLDALAKLDVRATFFLLGARALDQEALVRRLVEEGHAIGSHSWSHPHPRSTNAARLFADYRRGRRTLESIVRRDVHLFRAPHGYFDWRVAVATRALDLEPWHWSQDPEDWQPGATAEEIVASLADVRAGDVILLHDGLSTRAGGDRSATVAALEGIVAGVRARGLAFATLPG
jgi:peptidoglycan-N-acetylglucosamine deacetylase